MVLILISIGCSDKSVKEYDVKNIKSENKKEIKKSISRNATLTGYIVDRDFLDDVGLYMYTMQLVDKDPILFFHKDKILFNKKDLVKVNIKSNYMISFDVIKKYQTIKKDDLTYILPENKQLQKRTIDRQNYNISIPTESKIDLF